METFDKVNRYVEILSRYIEQFSRIAKRLHDIGKEPEMKWLFNVRKQQGNVTIFKCKEAGIIPWYPTINNSQQTMNLY